MTVDEDELFGVGLDDASEPPPDRDEARDGDAITGVTSWWHTGRCSRCGHTFRRGDLVHVDSRTREVTHLDPVLSCAVEAKSGTDDTDASAFVAGLLAAWPVTGDVQVISTDEVPYLCRPPDGGFRRRSCLVCAHSFRPAEMVIICPCAPADPRCRAAVHRDPAQGLVCWETWLPASELPACPVMTRSLGR
ncbi:hypothetical protein [Actinoplanes aureus]|uniref:Uncharacterized protein n=1 Tax=Actinoplanes aureus TaxID=2792083 RepID=A0A931C385_9ACTN|nr:hypothetical protein [Actinoplanes aureus]MBG0562565.1 hypothetical protein [Actinoplanes aureus]